MIPPFDYQIPKTLREACDLLWKYGEKARVIAGGTDLVILLRDGKEQPQCVVDITHIPELRKIEEKDGMICIGAGVTHSEISSSPLVRRYGRVLSDAAGEIGSPQIRNTGTIGGNIVNASPAADTLPPLMILNAVAKVATKEGEREVPLQQVFEGPYQTNLKPHEILVRITFQKLPPDAMTSFVRLARREAMAIARMSVALLLQMEKGNDRIRDIRVSLGAVTPTPRRLSGVEVFLKGKSPGEVTLKMVSKKVSEEMVKQAGVRPSTSYKSPVVEALFMRAFREALGSET
jgi:CO/xanthine dehydrogenase FAD-binding subunit